MVVYGADTYLEQMQVEDIPHGKAPSTSLCKCILTSCGLQMQRSSQGFDFFPFEFSSITGRLAH